ncbi:MAG: hypothetical protein DI551_11480, partial [Micavibrio aeruginosavorus]
NDALNDGWQNIALEYPVLLRFLSSVQKNYFDSMDEFFQRIDADADKIKEDFGISANGNIIKIGRSLSDPHNGGRSVMRIEFADGNKLIYKPKSIKMEKVFNNFISGNNNFGFQPIHILSCEGYGWVQDIGELERQPINLANPESAGQVAAFLWMLNATDMHFENVMPTADGVYALDLETLLLASFNNDGEPWEPMWRKHTVNATLLFEENVLNRPEGFRIGGLEPSPALVSIMPPVTFTLQDDVIVMMLGQQDRKSLPPAKHQRMNVDGIKRLQNSFEKILNGDAREVVRRFVSSMDDDLTLRLVLRDTSFYTNILERMRQPRFLRDAQDMHKDLAVLYQGVGTVEDHDLRLRIIIDNEIKQLVSCDVPFLFYEVGRKDIKISDITIPDFFRFSAKEHAFKKIEGFDSSDIAEQKELMAISLEGRCGDFLANHRHHYHFEDQEILLPDTTLTKEFTTYANETIASALISQSSPARWLTLESDVEEGRVKAVSHDQSFFGGYWGIIMVLQAAEIALTKTGDAGTLKAFLEREAQIWPRIIEKTKRSDENLSFKPLGYVGHGGDLFAQSVLMGLDPIRWAMLEDSIQHTLLQVKKRVHEDDALDIIEGSAGLIMGCEQVLKFHGDKSWSSDVLHVQKSATDRLVEKATAIDGGLAWIVPAEAKPLLGYAHGWAGIVTALSTVARHGENAHDVEEINACLDKSALYPQVVHEQAGAWHDVRQGRASTLNNSWCNGIPGFVRGMIEIKDRLSPSMRQEAEELVNIVSGKAGLSNSYRFCCGEAGNVDLLMDIARRSEKGSFSETFERYATATLFSVNNRGSSNVMPEMAFPSLFQGKSGIAYTALRTVLPILPSLAGQEFPQKKLKII